MPSLTREHDLVLLGATGFVGRLTAAHLAQHAPDGIRIALAGRSAGRLAEVRAALGERAADWPLLTVDALDEAAVAALAASTSVVATTVGPYARYGGPLVAACAAAGTHYCDLTGEVLFVRQSIDANHEAARASGARIVHACGFDSIPSDLGVLATAEAAAADGEGTLERTVLHVRSMRGGFSGGSIDSMRQQAITMTSDPASRRVVGDPYSLSPAREEEPPARERGPRATGLVDRIRYAVPARHDDVTGRWTGPFVMASFNTRIVRRSNALSGWSYGRGFRYDEVMDTGTGPLGAVKAGALGAGLGAVVAGMAFPPTRAVLDRVLPAPGEGPSEKSMAEGRFVMDVEATTTTGARYRTRVAADQDPGYTGTAVMLGQSALCLALDEQRLPDLAGVLTPATAMGAVLLERLRQHGFTATTERLGDGEGDTGRTPSGDAR
ncbi:MAG TPA: saccharopine dehydrogenase NADP-binding domain-containing protein [Dermatophilaceae bacterium]|nr:saccharopine dehydrogenase NADP-binding domain-containing protein [Dermatophilaceae bacterium]